MPNTILSNSPHPAVRLEVAPSGGGNWIDVIRQSVHEARAALAAVLDAAGVDSEKVRESARQLNVNRGLVWRVTRAVGAQDDVTAATNLPGVVGLERLLEACRARGVGEELLEAARTAVREFHRVAHRNSGDRRTLEILLANAGTQTTSLDLEGARRSLFEGGCAVWGVRADVRMRGMFIMPNRDDPMMLDEADVAGYVGFRRLRQVAWPMSYKAVYRDTGEEDSPHEELIDEDGGSETSSLPLVREFCVPRDLKINLVQTGRVTRHELPAEPTAGAETTTCVIGAIQRRIYTARRTPGCQIAGSLLVLDTPVERVIFDTFVHKSLNLGVPDVRILDRMTRPHGYNPEDLESETLPIACEPRLLGPGSAGTVTPHMPWYPRLIEKVCRRIGFRSDEFIAHRMELVYPPIPTAMIVQFSLPAGE